MASDEELMTFVKQSFDIQPDCSMVEELPFDERCSYVTKNAECAAKTFIFNYINILYCFFDPSNDFVKYLTAILILSAISIAFLILGTTAELFFCPSLKVISKLLYMNEHLAGVTLLAFGNGSPDVFNSLASIEDSSRLMFSDLLGAGIFVSCFVSGIVIAVTPFKLHGYSMLRDTCFYLIAVMYIDYAIISNDKVTFTESTMIMLLYCAYLIVVILDQILLKFYIYNMEKHMTKRKFATEQNLDRLERLQSEANLDVVARKTLESINIDATRSSDYNYRAPRNHRLIAQFVDSLNPFEENWVAIPRYKKPLVLLIKAPINLLLKLFMPCVDYELDRHGWCKLLNTVQIVTFPFLMLLFTCRNIAFWGVPIYCFSFIVTIPIAVLVFLTTRTDIAPKHHYLFAIFTILGSMYIIYASAEETVHNLYVLGLISKVSNAFLGCTLIAWGNSVSDLVSNVALARHNYPRMAIAACFGGPLFNCLISMGVTWTVQTSNSENGYINVVMGVMGETCVTFLVITLFATLIWGYSTNFVGRRCIGTFLCIMYGIFFIYTILVEVEIMQSYSPIKRYDAIDKEINKQLEQNSASN